MRFVVDAQLPPALARLLNDLGHQAEHVADLNLLDARDPAIWDFALANDAAIVTKDEDFSARCLRSRQTPVIIWLRVGNCSRAALIEWFLPLLPRILGMAAAGEVLIEVR